MSDNGTLLSAENVSTYFFTEEGVAKAVQDVSFSIKKGKTFALVGESGCGKSVTALSIMRLVPAPQGKIVGGDIFFEGQSLLSLSEKKMRQVRGNKIAMIFQEPMTSLNPVYTLGRQIAEVYTEHEGLSNKEAMARAEEMLDKLQIPLPSKRIHEYPHNLSGGMRQRVMIAMALACSPELILADEPTTALDVTIQAQILERMMELQESLQTSVILITHNLGIVAEFARRVIVMYAGKIVEEAPVIPLFEEPLHPYTRGLLHSIPKLGRKALEGKQRLAEIPGMVPSLNNLPEGCHFHPRCSQAREICRKEEPGLLPIQVGHRVACWAVTEGWE
jgi:oligopeptide/dipeptide ABC transporter ATP-binding protein